MTSFTTISSLIPNRYPLLESLKSNDNEEIIRSLVQLKEGATVSDDVIDEIIVLKHSNFYKA